MKLRFLAFSLLAISLPTSIVWAQSSQDPSSFSQPIPLYTKALGVNDFSISSDDEMAQKYFSQGFQMMYAFTKEDAARSFREAQKYDDDCAICYWGEAWAWGSYLNGAMTNAEAPRAYAAITKAKARIDQANEKEQELINAMALRYIENYNREERAIQDTAYAKAMEEVYTKYPDDLDIGTLYAESVFLLEPRRGTRDLNDPDVQNLHAILEGILEKDIQHPGACHLYIHATESTSNPGLAEACAEFIGTAIPGASHINHMPSHTWNEIGRWSDAVRSNIMAWHSDLKAEIGEGFAIYPSHNLHMLAFAASMDGQGAVAIQAGKDYAKLTGNNMYHVLTLIRFGRFDELEAISTRPAHDIHGGMWDFAQSYAALKLGDSEQVNETVQGLLSTADSSSARFRFHSAQNLLSIVAYILEGEYYSEKMELDKAINSFEKAVKFYDALTYDEPEPLPFSPRSWLGAAQLEKQNYEEALQTFSEELKHHPQNGWSLLGLKLALEAQGKSFEEVEAQFIKSWNRSDTWIQTSKF